MHAGLLNKFTALGKYYTTASLFLLLLLMADTAHKLVFVEEEFIH